MKIFENPPKKPVYLKKLAHRIPIIMHFWDPPERFWPGPGPGPPGRVLAGPGRGLGPGPAGKLLEYRFPLTFWPAGGSKILEKAAFWAGTGPGRAWPGPVRRRIFRAPPGVAFLGYFSQKTGQADFGLFLAFSLKYV